MIWSCEGYLLDLLKGYPGEVVRRGAWCVSLGGGGVGCTRGVMIGTVSCDGVFLLSSVWLCGGLYWVVMTS